MPRWGSLQFRVLADKLGVYPVILELRTSLERPHIRSGHVSSCPELWLTCKPSRPSERRGKIRSSLANRRRPGKTTFANNHRSPAGQPASVGCFLFNYSEPEKISTSIGRGLAKMRGRPTRGLVSLRAVSQPWRLLVLWWVNQAWPAPRTIHVPSTTPRPPPIVLTAPLLLQQFDSSRYSDMLFFIQPSKHKHEKKRIEKKKKKPLERRPTAWRVTKSSQWQRQRDDKLYSKILPQTDSGHCRLRL